MISVLSSLTSLATLIVVVQALACSKDKFGPQCTYDCHCNRSCDQNSGRCPGVCNPPWSGRSCQRENVAYRKRTYSNGDYNERWTHDKAVDGKRNQDVHDNFCYHSGEVVSPSSAKPDGEAWLYVDLDRPYHIRNITVFGRGESYSADRLKDTRLFVSNTTNYRDKPCYTFTGDSARTGNIVNLTCDKEGRYITLYTNHTADSQEDPGEKEKAPYLEICELEVYVCSNASYGETCDELCHCRDGISCDDVIGRCPRGCIPGYLGENCNERCQEKRFGENCTSTCHCLSPGCDPVSGNCDVPGCKAGYHGRHCNTACPSGRFGADCGKECHCQNGWCDRETGGGCQGRCAAGFLGKTCSSRCQETHFGENCASICHCLSPGCDPVSGSCRVPGCEAGYHGHHCNTDVDECAVSGDVCGDNCSLCVNTPGSFLCVPLNQSAGHNETWMVGAVGGGVGGAALLLQLLLIIVFCRFLRRKTESERPPEEEPTYDDTGVKMDDFYSPID